MKKFFSFKLSKINYITFLALVLLPSLAALTILPSCSYRESLFFDDPAPDLVIVGNLGRTARYGGTFYHGSVRNDGGLTAEKITINITVIGGDGSTLGTFSAIVGKDFSEDEGVDDTLEAGENGAFALQVPIPLSQIASENISFSFVTPLEEE